MEFLMKWPVEFTKAIKIQWILIALFLLLTVTLGFSYFVLRPGKKRVEYLKNKMDDMAESYVMMRSMNISRIINQLNEEVSILNQKEKEVISKPLAQEQIPVFLSKLEREANRSGLQISSPLVNSNAKNTKSIKTIVIDFSFEGEFQEVLNFLRNLDSSQMGILVKDFSINAANERISGNIKFISFISF